MSLLNNKNNTQSNIQSLTVIGLRVEKSHVNELHADKIYDAEGTDIFEELKELKRKLGFLSIPEEELTDGMVVSWNAEQKKWIPIELVD